jgi:DNA-binding NarL/FixJ family response regulator
MLAAHTGVLQPADLEDREEAIARSRTRLGEAAFEESLAQGRVTPLDQLLAAAAQRPALAASAPVASGSRAKPSAPHESLTARELDVLRLLTEGLSYADIGQRLFISPRTVDAHLRAIYAKLNVRSRHEATRYAQRHALARQRDVP